MPGVKLELWKRVILVQVLTQVERWVTRELYFTNMHMKVLVA